MIVMTTSNSTSVNPQARGQSADRCRLNLDALESTDAPHGKYPLAKTIEASFATLAFLAVNPQRTLFPFQSIEAGPQEGVNELTRSACRKTCGKPLFSEPREAKHPPTGQYGER